MAYCTKQDLIERYGEDELIQLTDPLGVTANDVTIARAIADAEAAINARLEGRYTLPLASVPRFLTLLACDLARYMLYQDRVTEEVKRRHDAAIKSLDAIANGTLNLGVDAAGAVTPSVGSPEIVAPGRVFSRKTMEGY